MQKTCMCVAAVLKTAEAEQGIRLRNSAVFFIPLSALLIFAFCWNGHAAETRIALVIGNGSYASAPLKNPENDAADVARALNKLGFETRILVNATQRKIEEAVRHLGTRLQGGGVGLFYYAGHGVQMKGLNYIIPIDAEIRSGADIKYEAVDVGRVLAQMEDAGNSMNIIILDACRDNPFASRFRSASRGLARMDAPKGSILAYATSPGSVAEDGDGRNGLYTDSLLKFINEPGLAIEGFFKKVRRTVAAASNGRQIAWETSSLMQDFYFLPDMGPNADKGRSGEWAGKKPRIADPPGSVGKVNRFAAPESGEVNLADGNKLAVAIPMKNNPMAGKGLPKDGVKRFLKTGGPENTPFGCLASPDGAVIAVPIGHASFSRRNHIDIHLFSLPGWTKKWEYRLPSEGELYFDEMHFSPGGELFGVSGLSIRPCTASIAILDTRTGKELWKVEKRFDNDNIIEPALCFSPDGEFVATVFSSLPFFGQLSLSIFESNKYKIEIRKALTGEVVKAISGFRGEVPALRYSTDGMQIFATELDLTSSSTENYSSKGRFVQIDAGTGKKTFTLKGYDSIIDLNAGKNMLALLTSHRDAVHLYDIKHREIVGRIRIGRGAESYGTVRLSRDWRYLAAAYKGFGGMDVFEINDQLQAKPVFSDQKMSVSQSSMFTIHFGRSGRTAYFVSTRKGETGILGVNFQ